MPTAETGIMTAYLETYGILDEPNSRCAVFELIVIALL